MDEISILGLKICKSSVFCYLAVMSNKRTYNDNKKYGQAGYPAVERLIDTEDFNELNAAFETAYGDLMDIAKHKKGLKTQKEAKKAMRSLELTMELLRELLAIKYRLQEEAAKKAS